MAGASSVDATGEEVINVGLVCSDDTGSNCFIITVRMPTQKIAGYSHVY